MARGWRITGRDRPIACNGLLGMRRFDWNGMVSVVLSQWVPMPPESLYCQWPNALSLAGWGVELALLFLLLWQPFDRPATPHSVRYRHHQFVCRRVSCRRTHGHTGSVF